MCRRLPAQFSAIKSQRRLVFALGDYKLRIEMTDWDGKSYWAEYSHFRLSDEVNKYSLHAHGYRYVTPPSVG